MTTNAAAMGAGIKGGAVTTARASRKWWLSAIMGLCTVGCLGLTTAMATNKPEPLSKLVLCKNTKLVRSIRVETENNQCTTIYTKFGRDQEIGSGRNSKTCQHFMDNVRGNLEDGGWRCREVSRATITKPSAEM